MNLDEQHLRAWTERRADETRAMFVNAFPDRRHLPALAELQASWASAWRRMPWAHAGALRAARETLALWRARGGFLP